jgi:hypothetical protein
MKLVTMFFKYSENRDQNARNKRFSMRDRRTGVSPSREKPMDSTA